MKLAVIATAATLLVATQASAIDLGNGLSAGAEFDMNYTTGTEIWAVGSDPRSRFGHYGYRLIRGIHI